MDGLLNGQVNAALLQSQAQEGPRVNRVETAEQARQVGEEFEAVFLAQMLEHMMGESTEDSMFSGAGQGAWKGMLNEEYAKVMAKAGGIGLADDLAREVMRYQDIGEDQ
ncbi:hypothetical protein GCM10011367_13360 [Marinicauda pacifica]|jgi:Rod binding domain-containing protein|uniref:Chemotactic signal-response protein chel n=1 Tax=Marinicauda pacifica TaxID=1133559 RepID=A0A4V3RZ38_9PROT|nr:MULTISPECIES: rod-binding protein [Marinicauda]TGY92769.1 chemotactic signal-response protein chel [Marinicauda pacifica]GGE40246.1 hypothetical protein GCM10011367_13360 [Marinicauda pacifica]